MSLVSIPVELHPATKSGGTNEVIVMALLNAQIERPSEEQFKKRLTGSQ